MHTILVDTGSTKAEWIWIKDKAIHLSLITAGFNPFTSDGESFINSAQRHLADWPLQAKDLRVYYYGTGTKTEVNKQKVHQLLRMLCGNTKDIYVYSDLIGACHACCGDEPGIVAILGTGTNSCLYDGKQIVDQLTSLGYLGGDPASGYDMGKRLIQQYAWRTCPIEIQKALEEKYPQGIDQIIEELYASIQPNVFLASFAPYLIEFRNTSFVKELVSSAFDEFIISNLAKYDNPKGLPVSFVGSIAHFFKNELSLCLEKNGMQLGEIVRQPGSALAQYILKSQ